MERKQYKMDIFYMKCIPISNVIKLEHRCLQPSLHILCGYEMETKEWKERSSVYYSIRPKSFPGNEHTGVWYMGSPLPCNGNLSVLYDFIQNPSPLCGATKHIKAKWWIVLLSAKKQVEDPICILHPHVWGMGEFILIIVQRIFSTVYCSGPLDEYCRSCIYVQVSVVAQVSQCGMPVLHKTKLTLMAALMKCLGPN